MKDAREVMLRTRRNPELAADTLATLKLFAKQYPALEGFISSLDRPIGPTSGSSVRVTPIHPLARSPAQVTEDGHIGQ